MFSTAMSPILYVLLILAFCIPLCLVAYFKKILSWDGTAVALAIGVVIGVFGSSLWLLLLFILLFSSFFATKYKFEYKVQQGVQEGKHGERGAKNVFVHGFLPMLIATLNFFIRDLKFQIPSFNEYTAGLLYIVTVSAAGADTIASELGVLSNKSYLITNSKRVAPGTNGAVSAFGTLCALLAAFYISIIGWYMFTLEYPTWYNILWILFIPVTAGFLGCNIDSVIGATLETKGYFGKHMTNLISIMFAVLFAYGVIIWLNP